MCLYPLRIVNKKYTVTEKNGGVIPTPPIIGTDANGDPIYDERVLFVNVPCGKCIECRKKKARNWAIRLNEELPQYQYKYMVTLTFTDKAMSEIIGKVPNIDDDNTLPTYGIRHMLERWRKDHKKSLRHFFITELGHEGTERIHAHGIIFSDEPLEFKEIERKKGGIMAEWQYWKYGHVFVGDYVNERTINYITKYITKIDSDHPTFEGLVLCSPGMGKAFKESGIAKLYKYTPGQSKLTYALKNGLKMPLPTYYKNYFYNEEERELIWRETMDKEVTFINGLKFANRTYNDLDGVIRTQQEYNLFLGYGDNSIKWKKGKWARNIHRIKMEEKRKQEIKEYYAATTKKNIEKMQKNIENIIENLEK